MPIPTTLRHFATHATEWWGDATVQTLIHALIALLSAAAAWIAADARQRIKRHAKRASLTRPRRSAPRPNRRAGARTPKDVLE